MFIYIFIIKARYMLILNMSNNKDIGYIASNRYSIKIVNFTYQHFVE